MTSTLILFSVLMLVSSPCICIKTGTDTVNSFSCRPGHQCGRHNYDYTWCYTDADNSWDYCCDTACTYDDNNDLRCHSGTYDVFCGRPGEITALGNGCRSSHHCGLHNEEYFWCYTDDKNNWEYCCHPGATCTSRSSYQYKVCNAGTNKVGSSYWPRCRPLQ